MARMRGKTAAAVAVVTGLFGIIAGPTATGSHPNNSCILNTTVVFCLDIGPVDPDLHLEPMVGETSPIQQYLIRAWLVHFTRPLDGGGSIDFDCIAFIPPLLTNVYLDGCAILFEFQDLGETLGIEERAPPTPLIFAGTAGEAIGHCDSTLTILVDGNGVHDFPIGIPCIERPS